MFLYTPYVQQVSTDLKVNFTVLSTVKTNGKTEIHMCHLPHGPGIALGQFTRRPRLVMYLNYVSICN